MSSGRGRRRGSKAGGSQAGSLQAAVDQICELLNQELFPFRKLYGMFGRINFWIVDLGPELITLRFSGPCFREDCLEVATKLRDCVRDHIPGCVSCAGYRALYFRGVSGQPDREYWLAFRAGAARPRSAVEPSPQVVQLRGFKIERLWRLIQAQHTGDPGE